MLGTDAEDNTPSYPQCLYTAPNWYQSHVLACNEDYIAYGARNMIQLLSHTLQPLKMLSAHRKRVTTVCFVSAKTLVSACDGGEVMAWDVMSGEVSARLLQTPLAVSVVTFSRGVLFAGDEKGFVCVWEDYTRENSMGRFQPFTEKILTMSCSDHEEKLYLAIGYRMGTIAVMAVNTGVRHAGAGSDMTLVHTLKGHDSDIFRVSWCQKSFALVYPSLIGDIVKENTLVSTSRDKSIKIWDGVNNRFMRAVHYPPKLSSARESNLNKEQPWAAVLWTAAGIVGSSPTGDLAKLEEHTTEEGISELKWSSFDSPHSHSKKVFSMCDLGHGQVISTSMDRETILWREGECVKVAHGLGGFAYGLDISPLAPNRIAVATGDNMVRIWEPYQNKVTQVWQSVRTKVMTIAWHPYREGLVGFGTEEGRVGVYDVNTGSMNTSSTYHEKPVYSMSWGYVPTKFEDDQLKTGLYTCGGEGTILCHKPKELGKPAVNVNAYIAAENKYKHMPPGRTAVDWEFNAQLLAVGCNNGLIEVFKAPNLQQVAVFQYHSRIINKLRWGRNEGTKVCFQKGDAGKQDLETAPGSPAVQLLLASCSDDNRICVEDLSSVVADPSSTPRLAASQTLTGHTARITDIDWNPHNYRYIVSASYDGTAQVWDIADGSGVSNYRGHAGRVFSVRWSHTSIDCVFSGSDEFTVRQWRTTDNVELMPPTTNQLLPPTRNNRKKKKTGKKSVTISENKVEKVCASEKAVSWRKSDTPLPCTEPPEPRQETMTVSVGDTKRKRGSRGKSLLPLASRRDHSSKAEQAEQILQIATDMFGGEAPTSSGALTGADIGLYSTRAKVFELIAEERANHVSENHHHQAVLLGIWSSDLGSTVNTAIQTKTVTESLLSVAVMCGLDKYTEAVECYISQLTKSRDFVTAASYLLILGKTSEAIALLVEEECYREALAIAKMRLSPDDEAIKNIYGKWAHKQDRDMQFDSAVKCYLASGDAARAIMVSLRRKDVAALQTTVRVAEITKQDEMLPAIRAALAEAKAEVVEDNGGCLAEEEKVNVDPKILSEQKQIGPDIIVHNLGS